MKTTKLLLTLVIAITLSSFLTKENKTNVQEGYYYFAYASLDKYNEHVYTTPVLFISKKDCNLDDPRSKYGVSNQFGEYMKAEYKGIIYKIDANVYNSKLNAVKSRREIMSYAQKITKITDFEYLCD